MASFCDTHLGSPFLASYGRKHANDIPIIWKYRASHGQVLHKKLRYGINETSFCATPTKCLIEKIQNRDWDGVRQRAAVCPLDASYSSEKIMNNATPLHLVCLYRAPHDVVEAVLNANPKALHHQDNEGWTPLHVSLFYGADSRIILSLIRKGGAKAASMQSPLVGSPLQLACRHGSSTVILQELVSANPAMAYTPNDPEAKPARILWRQFFHAGYTNCAGNDQQILEKNAVSAPSNGESKELCSKTRVLELFQRLEILLRAVNKTSSGILLHDILAASRESGLGDLSEFAALAINMFPEQISTRDDYSGNFPLHVAVSNPRSPSAMTRKMIGQHQLSQSNYSSKNMNCGASTPAKNIHCTDEIVDILIRKFPLAAKIPNRQGKFPLHLSLSLGHRTWNSGIEMIIRNAPEALLERDPSTGLYPFQLAASIPANTDDEHIEVLEATFELLRASPHLI